MALLAQRVGEHRAEFGVAFNDENPSSVHPETFSVGLENWGGQWKVQVSSTPKTFRQRCTTRGSAPVSRYIAQTAARVQPEGESARSLPDCGTRAPLV